MSQPPNSSEKSEIGTQTNSSFKHFKILSYNLFMRPLVKTNASDYKDARLEELMIEWKSRKIDILCLQELFSTASSRSSRVLDEFCCKTNSRIVMSNDDESRHDHFHYVHLQQDYWKLKPIDSGLFILSRFPILERDAFIFSQGSDIDGWTTKGVIYALVDLSEPISKKTTNHQEKIKTNKCLIFNTHTQANYDLTNVNYWKIQQSQIIELALFVSEKMKQHPGVPVLLCGDFNVDARNRQEWYEWMVKTMNDIISDENVRIEMEKDYPLIRAQTVGLDQTIENNHHEYTVNNQEHAITDLNNDSSCHTLVHDIILEHYKHHPITFGDVIIDEETHQEKPREIHLSHPHTLCSKQRLSDHYSVYAEFNVFSDDDS